MKITTTQLRQIIKEEIEKELFNKQELNEGVFEKVLGSIALAGALLTGGAMSATNTAEERAEIADYLGVETTDTDKVKAEKLKQKISDLKKDIEKIKKSPGTKVAVGPEGSREIPYTKEEQDERIRQAKEALETAENELRKYE